MKTIIEKESTADGRRRLFDGAAALAVATVVTKVLGLLYKMPLSRILGDEGMGYFNSAYTVYTFFYILCSAGVPKAVAIVISENDARGNGAAENRIVRTAMIAFFTLGALATLAFMLFADELCRIIGNSGAAYTMLTVAPTLIFVSVAGVAKGHLNGNSRLLPLAVSQLIEGGAKFFLGILFALLGERQGFSLQMISAFTVLGITLGSAASALYLLARSKKVAREKAYKIPEKTHCIKRILKISFPLTLGAAVMSLSNMVDLTMIMRQLRIAGYSEAEASALYGNYTTLAVPMFNLVVSLVSPFFIAAVPILSRAHVNGDRLTFEDELNFTLKKAFFIAVPSVFVFTVYSKELLSLIFVSSAAQIGAPLLTVLAPSLIFLTGQTLVNTALEAKGYYRAPIISMLIGNIPKILISYFLISNEAYGISGAPIGTLASYATGFFISVIMLYVKTDVHVAFFCEFLRPMLCSLAAICITELGVNGFKLGEDVPSRLMILASFSAFYLLFNSLTIVFNKTFRKTLSISTKKPSFN